MAWLFHLLLTLASSPPVQSGPRSRPFSRCLLLGPCTASSDIPLEALFITSQTHQILPWAWEELSSSERTPFQTGSPFGLKELATSVFRKWSCRLYQKYLQKTAQNSILRISVHQINDDCIDVCCFHTLKQALEA